MIHDAVKIMTLFGVLLHAGLGCCAHHDHCVGEVSAESATEESSQEHGVTCSCAHHRHEKSSEDREEKPADEQCPCGHNHDGCSDHCFWLTAAKVELPDSQLEMPWMLADCRPYPRSSRQSQMSWLEAPPGDSHCGKSLRAMAQVWRL